MPGFVLAQGERGAEAGERDLEGRVRLFCSGARPDRAMVTRYVVERREIFGVEPICKAIGVPVSTHYARRSRKPSARELADRQLLIEIEAARSGRRRVYGARKTWKELKRRDVEVGRDQVARVMREHGLVGKLRGSKKRTTIPDEAAAERARDLLQRDFTATRPNAKWVADITYVRTRNGFVYLAFILDCYSRKIVAWQLATHMRAELVLDALEMASGLRRPQAGLIAHSDRGSQGGFNRSSRHLVMGRVCDGCRERQEAVRAMPGQMWSTGRPSVARREDRQRFWRTVAAGWSTEEAAAA